MNAQGTNGTYIAGNMIISVMYFTHFRPKSLLTTLWKHPGGTEQHQWCVTDPFHASGPLLSAEAASRGRTRAAAGRGALLGRSLVRAEGDSGCLQPSCSVLGDTGITAEPFTCATRGVLPRPQLQRQAIHKSWKYPDYHTESIRQDCLKQRAFTCSQNAEVQKFNRLKRAMKLLFQKRQKTSEVKTYCSHGCMHC